MLQAKGLTRCYGDFKAVDNVSFSVETGEIVGLLGLVPGELQVKTSDE